MNIWDLIQNEQAVTFEREADGLTIEFHKTHSNSREEGYFEIMEIEIKRYRPVSKDYVGIYKSCIYEGDEEVHLIEDLYKLWKDGEDINIDNLVEDIGGIVLNDYWFGYEE